MFTPRRYHILAIFVLVYSFVVTLLNPSLDTASAPPRSAQASFNPLWAPSVAAPVPDSGRLFTFRKHVEPPQITPAVPAPAVVATTPPRQVVLVSAAVAAPPRTPAPSRSTATETAIAYAMSKLGRPYVWGAAGPNTFDCSGLVQAAFRSAGIDLPRTTHTIIGRGTSVSRGALQRGDLVWPSSGHIGIYLGNGKIIHAPQPGDVVKISTLWSFYAGMRL